LSGHLDRYEQLVDGVLKRVGRAAELSYAPSA
jgi:hypothetical protein